MRSISRWGRDHKISARTIIILSYVLLNLGGLFLGDLLYSMNISWSPLWLAIPVSITLAGIILYPEKKRNTSIQIFTRDKKCAMGF